MITVEQFTEEVLSRLIAEHGAPRASFEYLVPQIAVAFDSEHAITPDQLSDLIHGTDEGIPVEVQKLFPLLNTISLSPYTEVDHSVEVEKIDDDEDEDEEDSSEDDEDEDD